VTAAAHRGRAIFVGALAAAAGGCAWDHLDAVTALPGIPPAAEASEAGPDANAAAADAGSGDDTGDAVEAMANADAGTPCAPSVAPIEQWTFDSTLEGWTDTFDTGVQASLVWTGSTGQPAPGAIDFNVTPGPSDAGKASGAWIRYDMPLGDLAGRTVAAWVWLAGGPSPHLKVFAQTGSQYVWADNGTVDLAPRTWTCVSLPVSSPSYDQASFDPTDVVRIGFETLSTEPFELVVDGVIVY
jgi:hypothetical protein